MNKSLMLVLVLGLLGLGAWSVLGSGAGPDEPQVGVVPKERKLDEAEVLGAISKVNGGSEPVALGADSGQAATREVVDVAPDTEPVAAQVEPESTGANCEVSLVDEMGEALDGGWFLVFLGPDDNGATKPKREVLDGAETALFEELVPGTRVVAYVTSIDGEPLKAERSKMAGVVGETGGEALHLTLEVPHESMRFVTGRLVNGDGEPLANVEAKLTKLQISGGSSGSSSGGLDTDENGHFSFDQLESFGDEASQGTFEYAVALDREDGPPLFSNLPVFEDPLDLPQRLGDVVMAEAPILASGFAVDGSGAPVEAATLEFSELYMRKGGRMAQRVGISQMTTPTGPDGVFELRGVTQARDLVLSARAEGYSLLAGVPIVAGSEGVQVVLIRAGSLRGSLKALADGKFPNLQFGIQPVDPALLKGFKPSTLTGGWSSDGKWWDSSTTDEGEFGWDDLIPGLYNLRMLGGTDDVLSSWDSIEIIGGEVNRDARLQNIEFVDDGLWVDLTVVDEAGMPLNFVRCALFRAGAQQSIHYVERGELHLHMGDADEMLLDASGFLSRRVPLDGGDVRVVMTREPR